MKKILLSIISMVSLSISSQAQELPKPSPSAEIEQRIGLTDINVLYSRPGVKGRTIWGELVKFDEVWRAGANKATMFSTSADIKIQGKELPKGDYSLFIIPAKEGDWTVIFNKETELWGAGDYKKEQDQLRVMAKMSKSPEMMERLEYRFMSVDEKSGQLVLDWENARLSMQIEADPSKQVMENINVAISESKEEDKWKIYRSAAAFARDNGSMTKEGLEWIKKSTELKADNWYSFWVYADLHALNKDYKSAILMAEKSMKIGQEGAKADDSEFSYQSRIQADIDEWESMK